MLGAGPGAAGTRARSIRVVRPAAAAAACLCGGVQLAHATASRVAKPVVSELTASPADTPSRGRTTITAAVPNAVT